ncbi:MULTISPECIES: precorrin-6y C5,15-methyltransferase (decarboxylating) subunit CbiE [Sulfurospirillum]|uniref:Cobalt-precorrin-6y C5-methyltransferase CbiE n=4 Tax=Sulfurospirillum TaxID=57665 RepID=A0A1D7TJY6_9BACT|nr:MULTISPECIES: precorrin-6y C5,15-methyltransferase (decarboxylating) subunit CbiE [Sulfurospirillum]AHJ12817.1 cobalt-precorrin-6y C5-methyltransferase CbiE [Sulfurospirillum multivorans DSM 12446]AOO65296.1 cobalt-precorrin-6y C5-methyltransferase CbiE [Sulfurospirillum halorespirans DSM 13726]WNZ00325.1 Cobalt-precorrin-7 C [Sulfurospirillum sp. 'SP']WNZ00378.1 Cobalt-precorrin-7 C [Sulfurospirillum sp. 'SP']
MLEIIPMLKIHILGMGPGSIDFIAPYVLTCIKDADILIGGKRHFQEIEVEASGKVCQYISSDLLGLVDYIKTNRNKKIAVLVSGDPGFYSFLVYLKKHFSNEELVVIPGLSSMQYMFCKIGLPWQDAVIKSLHGKTFDFIEALNDSGLVGVLTDSAFTPQLIAKELVTHGLGNVLVYVGEELSYAEEKITTMIATQMANNERNFGMNVVVIERTENVSYKR